MVITNEIEKELVEGKERFSSDGLNVSYGELINLYKNKELIIRPEYQRLYRWKTQQKTALIESILLSIPIPPLFVSEDEEGVWELIDGLQRLSTIISFFGELQQEGNDALLENNWQLEKGKLLPSIEGHTSDSLPRKLYLTLKRAMCRVEILRSNEKYPEMKYELFKRLNSGRRPLTAQEMRSLFFKERNSALANLLLDLSKNKMFQELIDIDTQMKTELYDQELILSFFAYFGRIDTIKEDTETYLNHFMESLLQKTDIPKLKDIFLEVIELVYSVNPKAFKNQSSNVLVPAYFEGITIGIAQNLENYKNHPSLLKDKIEILKMDREFKQSFASKSDNSIQIHKRLNRANAIFADN